MKPVYQTIFEEGKGNCLQAALASLLELELNEVPNFAEYGGRFWPMVWEWLKERNLGIIGIDNKPAGYHLIRVKSPRFGNMHHELVGFNGNPVHDPHPEGNCEHNGIVWYDVIYPLDISKWKFE